MLLLPVKNNRKLIFEYNINHYYSFNKLGGHRGNDQPVAAEQTSGPNAQPLYQTPNQQFSADRCNLYQKEFMKCLDQAGGDSTQCQGFWEALKVSSLFSIF